MCRQVEQKKHNMQPSGFVSHCGAIHCNGIQQHLVLTGAEFKALNVSQPRFQREIIMIGDNGPRWKNITIQLKHEK